MTARARRVTVGEGHEEPGERGGGQAGVQGGLTRGGGGKEAGGEGLQQQESAQPGAGAACRGGYVKLV